MLSLALLPAAAAQISPVPLVVNSFCDQVPAPPHSAAGSDYAPTWPLPLLTFSLSPSRPVVHVSSR